VLDCIDADLPAVINEELARTMETGELFPTVPDVFSPLLIAERLLELIQNARAGTRLGPNRERYLQEHSPARYAHALLQALDLLRPSPASWGQWPCTTPAFSPISPNSCASRCVRESSGFPSNSSATGAPSHPWSRSASGRTGRCWFSPKKRS